MIERHFPYVMARKMQNSSGMFSGQMNQDFVFLMMLLNAAFETRRKILPNSIKTTVKHGNAGIMVWGIFTATGFGELIRCETSINAKEYIRILETGLLPSIEKLGISQNIIFQQENAPAHTTKVTKKWLADNSIDVML